MSFDLKPKKFQKISLGSKILNLDVHKSQPIVLALTNDHKLDEFYLRDLDRNNIVTHPLPMKTHHISCIPNHFGFSQKNIVHCQQQVLKINNKHQLLHKYTINNLLIDDNNIALTTCEDTINIISIAKGEPLAQLHYYGDKIKSLFWSNSLVISGDQRGMVNLWDINKQKIINSNMIHASQVDFVSSYVDYIHTNFYYTFSKKQKRATFHDIRTYKPLKITNNLPSGIIDVQHNPTGKIFIATQKEVQFIDVYKSFTPVGKFTSVSSSNMQNYNVNNQNCDFQPRNIKQMLIWDKYVIVGCSNGCIEVYDSDMLKCLFALGMCEFSGVKKMKIIDQSLLVLQQKGQINSLMLK